MKNKDKFNDTNDIGHNHKTQNKDMQSKDTTHKTKRISITDLTNKPGMNSGHREG
jgi:hypothetical protein